MATQTKNIKDVTTVTSIADGSFMPIIDSAGGVTKATVANVRNAMVKSLDLNAIEDGVMIYTVDKDGTLRLVRPSKWAQYKSSGYTPIGIAVTSGEKRLVVALTECASSGLNWSTAQVSGGGVTTSNRQTAMADWNGESNTTAQIAHTECSGNNTAPGFCHAYSKLNSDNKGLGAGKWYLPSLGELIMIYANMEKINYALSLIDGATTLAETDYWSSTEHSATYAWGVYFGTGNVRGNAKATNSYRVRPVAAFQ